MNSLSQFKAVFCISGHEGSHYTVAVTVKNVTKFRLSVTIFVVPVLTYYRRAEEEYKFTTVKLQISGKTLLADF